MQTRFTRSTLLEICAAHMCAMVPGRKANDCVAKDRAWKGEAERERPVRKRKSQTQNQKTKKCSDRFGDQPLRREGSIGQSLINFEPSFT